MENAISYERIPTLIFENSEQASKAVAQEMAALIRQKIAKINPPCLGWPPVPRPKRSTRN